MTYRKLSRSGLRRSRAHGSFPQLMQLEARALMTVTPVVGPNINVSQAWYNQSETQIAVNPTDPKSLFAVSNQDYEHNNPDNLVFGRYSIDGGKSWHTPEMPKPLNYPPASLDPGVIFDKFGNLYVSYKEAVGTDDLAVIISTDGGKTFNSVPFKFIEDPGVDFDSLAVGPADAAEPDGPQDLWVCYGAKPGMKVVHAEVTGLGYVGNFSKPTDVPLPADVDRANFGNIAVGPQGQVAVTFMDASKNYRLGPEKIYVAIDPKGAKGKFQPAELVTTTNWGWNIYVPAANNFRGTFAEPFLAYDDGSGPFSGRLYLSYLDSPKVPGENTQLQDSSVYVRYLDKTGGTWSEHVPVSKGDGNAGTAFLPSISVDPISGFVGATWYDSRRVGGERASVFAAFSDNGGKSFSTSVRVSKEASNAVKSNPSDPKNQNDRQGFGDYVRNAFYNKVFYASWADNSNSTNNNPNGPDHYLDLYTARIDVKPQKLKPVAKAHRG